MSSTKKSILIIDDEADIVAILKLLLERSGFNVETFTNPSGALNNFKPGHHDLMICDYMMPDMNGCQLYEKLVKMDSKMKVLFITAYEAIGQEMETEFNRLGLERRVLLKKPFSTAEIMDRISQLLS